jgi:hypothetical protein
LHILDKGVNKPFKGYLREEFEMWMMLNGSSRKPMRAEVAQWIAIVTREKLSTLGIVLATGQGIKTTKTVTQTVWWESPTNQMKFRKTTSQEPTFFLKRQSPYRGSNMNEVGDEEPLFVLDITAEH